MGRHRQGIGHRLPRRRIDVRWREAGEGALLAAGRRALAARAGGAGRADLTPAACHGHDAPAAGQHSAPAPSVGAVDSAPGRRCRCRCGARARAPAVAPGARGELGELQRPGMPRRHLSFAAPPAAAADTPGAPHDHVYAVARVAPVADSARGCRAAGEGEITLGRAWLRRRGGRDGLRARDGREGGRGVLLRPARPGPRGAGHREDLRRRGEPHEELDGALRWRPCAGERVDAHTHDCCLQKPCARRAVPGSRQAAAGGPQRLVAPCFRALAAAWTGQACQQPRHGCARRAPAEQRGGILLARRRTGSRRRVFRARRRDRRRSERSAARDDGPPQFRHEGKGGPPGLPAGRAHGTGDPRGQHGPPLPHEQGRVPHGNLGGAHLHDLAFEHGEPQLPRVV
mmetsp:Transcript_36736/g.105040  ORF Transcript_36736/g.105040 Transcript_36736/m.105040 type:complete len:400 (-) Transcript_36736:65-1264(-)